jgi:Fe-S-cluster containining protein
MKVDQLVNFPCTQCGACCRVAVPCGLPAKSKGSLVCLHLDEETNRCTIYETRPSICRIETMVVQTRNYSRAEVYRVNAECCNALQEAQHLPVRLRVVF